MSEHGKAWRNERVARLLDAMVHGSIGEVKPQLNVESEQGFSFNAVNELLGTTDRESTEILESLADEQILVRNFFDKFLRCPQCQSVNLRPVYHCPHCGSGNVSRGGVIEHLLCRYAGTEDEFYRRGKLVCPKCQQELHAPNTDYRNLGVLYKCHDCQEVATYPALRWRCLKCSSLTAVDRVLEVNAYSYTLNEGKKGWLGFELRPKAQLLEYLKARGYEVKENATVEGRSGARHTVDMLATRDLGVLVHRVALGIQISEDSVGLDSIFDFDEKAYDCGITHKVFIAIPQVNSEAERFAARQRIRVLDPAGLNAFLSSPPAPEPVAAGAESEHKPFRFQSKSHLVAYLEGCGYQVGAYARLRGRSEAEHTFDLLATRDDGILVHHIAVGTEIGKEPVGMERVFDFDDKAYDCGITDKVLIAVPGLTEEARRLARRQRIVLFELGNVDSID